MVGIRSIDHQTSRPEEGLEPILRVEATKIAAWLQLIRGEYLEMPGLHLTGLQAQRLWHLDSVTCEALLNALIDVRFLRRTLKGAFVRADDTR